MLRSFSGKNFYGMPNSYYLFEETEDYQKIKTSLNYRNFKDYYVLYHALNNYLGLSKMFTIQYTKK